MPLDLTVPGQLTLALLPDLTLMGGAMLLLLLAAWRPASDRHQRTVGYASMGLLLLTLGLVGYFAWRDFTATGAPAVIALDRSEEHTSELQSPCNLVCR